MNSGVILLLNMDYFPKDYNYFMANIKSLREDGIQIICTNVTAGQLLLVKKMQPLFILFKEYHAIKKDVVRKYRTTMKNALHKLKLQYYNQ
ncbi:hypothetical protein FACS1894218_7090 [Bacilli bacterium]|nr:hypothetical protein FACS1894218_7090 [Bacilli bacterium]